VPAQYRRHPAHPHGGPPGQLKKIPRGERVIVEDNGVRAIRGGKHDSGKHDSKHDNAKNKKGGR
jgi:hypothetical protein